MAEAPKKEELKKDAGKKAVNKGSGMPFSVRFAIFMIFVTALVFLPSTIVVSICMVPTLVAAIVDNNLRKTAWLTVGAMNFAGTVPAVFNVWDMGHTVPAAFQLVAQPMTIMLSFGGAAVGWMIYYNLTPIVAMIILKKNEVRLREIEKRQKELVKKWGGEVAA
jgi:hypothetical protein